MASTVNSVNKQRRHKTRNLYDLLLILLMCSQGGPATQQITYPPQSNACQSGTCQNGGSCHIDRDNVARCQCRRGYLGLNCETDICLQTLLVGQCKQHLPRYWYDASRSMCQPFIYTGCQGEWSTFSQY